MKLTVKTRQKCDNWGGATFLLKIRMKILLYLLLKSHEAETDLTLMLYTAIHWIAAVLNLLMAQTCTV